MDRDNVRVVKMKDLSKLMKLDLVKKIGKVRDRVGKTFSF